MLTADGKIFLIALGSILALYVLSIAVWAAWCVFKRGGICPVPKITLFGFWGIAVCPWLMLVAIEYRNHEALIAHERCHQDQQRRDGLLTFWFRYFTNKQARQDYEVEAYKVWVQVAPKDLERCVWYLTKSYEFDLTDAQARKLLTKPAS